VSSIATAGPTEMNIVGRVVDGRFVGVLGVSRDVSERERLERELRDSEARTGISSRRHRTCLGSPVARDDRVHQRPPEGLTGWRPDEVIGHDFGS
jgi:PAS domain-containing protein